MLDINKGKKLYFVDDEFVWSIFLIEMYINSLFKGSVIFIYKDKNIVVYII